jgi:Ca-activated chloride channel family protein
MQDSLKLPLVQRLLTETLEVLDEEDRVAIVIYAGGTGVALKSTPAHSGAAAEVIDSLNAGGSTAGASGLDLAYEEVASNFIEGGINHVILCTDGDFNVGPSSTADLVAAIEQKRESGITFTAVGFGTDPNDEMLEAISNKGNGVYGIVGSEEQAEAYAHERMLSSVQLVAKDLKIQVEFNPKHVYAYRLIGYEDRALLDEEFRDDAVDAGEVGAGHRVTALYDLALTEQDLPDDVTLTQGEGQGEQQVIAPSDLALVHVRYKHLSSTSKDPAIETQAALAASAIGEPDLDLRWAASVAAFAEVLRDNPYASTDMLDAIEQNVSLVLQTSDDPAKREFKQLFEQARPLLER